MALITSAYLLMWSEARTRFTNQLMQITEQDLLKRLSPSPNSAGFLIRHIGDVEFLFAKNVFGASHLKVLAKTVIDKQDTGQWTNLAELTQYVHDAAAALHGIVSTQEDSDWNTVIETKEFGKKTKSEAFGRIVSHTAYHAGQLALVLKYGRIV